MNSQKVLDVNEEIGLKMVEDKEFCLSIVNCKDRDEVKAFLKSNGIDASDADVDDLAKNISEIADICTRIDDDELDKIVGGKNGAEGSGDESKPEVPPSESNDTSRVWLGLGVGFLVLGGIGVLSVIGSWIKKKGDEKGWWKKKA